MPKLNDNLTVTNIITEDGCRVFVLAGDDGANHKMVMQDDVALMVDHDQTPADPHPVRRMPKPLPAGTNVLGGATITDVYEVDPNDDYQPYQYMLSDGTLYWIPIDDYEHYLKQAQPGV